LGFAISSANRLSRNARNQLFRFRLRYEAERRQAPPETRNFRVSGNSGSLG
jgi:hypothetical protein